MDTLSHKTTVLLSPSEISLLRDISRKTSRTMGDLIREAIKKTYLHIKVRKSKKTWAKLFKMNAPVSDWKMMEAEILKGRLRSL